MNNYKHVTVLLKEAVSSLNIHHDGIYIDSTFGYGGHSRLILSQLGLQGRLLAIDCDQQAIAIAKNIHDPRFSIIHDRFSSLIYHIDKYKLVGKINGILFDLGISSLQLDDNTRGFSFMHNGPLDMRMNQHEGQSVAQWLQTANENDISWVIKTFGEDRFNKRIARAIVKYNNIKPITHTKELVKVIITAIPKPDKYKHPATRTFQALRIWINNELTEITKALDSSLDILAPGGRLVVISFNSLEDRIVKHFMRTHSSIPQIPSGLPITETQLNKLSNFQLRVLNKVMPSKNEIIKNPRARSAILRIAERI